MATFKDEKGVVSIRFESTLMTSLASQNPMRRMPSIKDSENQLHGDKVESVEQRLDFVIPMSKHVLGPWLAVNPQTCCTTL